MRSSLVVSVLAAAALACGRDPLPDAPRGFVMRPVAAAADSTLACPSIDGKYRVQRRLIWNRLVQPSLSESSRRLPWNELTISGDAVTGLQLVLSTGELRDTVRLSREEHYDCRAGWLMPRGAIWRHDLAPEDSARSVAHPKRHEFVLGLASDTGGTLVGRLWIKSWVQVDVWCGDGCRGFPLPWSVEDSVQWEYLGSAAQPPLGVADENVSRRVASEERMAELGEQAARPLSIERMVRAMMPRGSEILAVRREGAGHRISIIVPSKDDMPDFIGRLINTQGLTGSHEVPGYGASLMEPARRWQTVIWVPKDY